MAQGEQLTAYSNTGLDSLVVAHSFRIRLDLCFCQLLAPMIESSLSGPTGTQSAARATSLVENHDRASLTRQLPCRGQTRRARSDDDAVDHFMRLIRVHCSSVSMPWVRRHSLEERAATRPLGFDRIEVPGWIEWMLSAVASGAAGTPDARGR